MTHKKKVNCPQCNGSGGWNIEVDDSCDIGPFAEPLYEWESCPECCGKGYIIRTSEKSQDIHFDR